MYIRDNKEVCEDYKDLWNSLVLVIKEVIVDDNNKWSSDKDFSVDDNKTLTGDV